MTNVRSVEERTCLALTGHLRSPPKLEDAAVRPSSDATGLVTRPVRQGVADQVRDKLADASGAACAGSRIDRVPLRSSFLFPIVGSGRFARRLRHARARAPRGAIGWCYFESCCRFISKPRSSN